MSREEMERQVRGQILGAMRDGKALGRDDPKQAEQRVRLVMWQVDCFVAAQEADRERREALRRQMDDMCRG